MKMTQMALKMTRMRVRTMMAKKKVTERMERTRTKMTTMTLNQLRGKRTMVSIFDGRGV